LNTLLKYLAVTLFIRKLRRNEVRSLIGRAPDSTDLHKWRQFEKKETDYESGDCVISVEYIR
jgi:hypothetical protein